jgi:hypothetical protein
MGRSKFALRNESRTSQKYSLASERGIRRTLNARQAKTLSK